MDRGGLGAHFYNFFGATGLCFFPATLPGRSTFYFHARNMLAQPVGWAPMLLAVHTQGLKSFPEGIGILAYLGFAGWEILVAKWARMVKNQSWAGEAQYKRHLHAGDRNVEASFKGKSWTAWSFGEGTVFFLAMPVRHPLLVRWSVMSQYGMWEQRQGWQKGSKTQSIDPPLNLPQVPWGFD